MRHGEDVQPRVSGMVVDPLETRVGRVRPHDKRDLHEPGALRQKEAYAHEHRPEVGRIVDLDGEADKRERDQDGPHFVRGELDRVIALQVARHDHELNHERHQVEHVGGLFGQGRAVVDHDLDEGAQDEAHDHANVVCVLVLEAQVRVGGILGVDAVHAAAKLHEHVKGEAEHFGEALDGQHAERFARAAKARHVGGALESASLESNHTNVLDACHKAPPQSQECVGDTFRRK